MSLINQSELQTKLDNIVDVFADKLKQLRAGRPRTETFAELSVMMYGAPTSLQSVANISIESATSVVIKPYFADKALMDDIVVKVREMNLGFNPVNDGDKVRVNIPAMTEERRRETVKEMGNMLEEARKSVRQIRHDFIEKVDKQEGVSEDDQKRTKNDIQKAVDATNVKLDDMADKKEAELTTL